MNGRAALLLPVWVALFTWLLSSHPAEAAGRRPPPDVRPSMVKIYTVRNTPDYYNPWNMKGPQSSGGSGCVIAGGRILTNAHVVSDQTFVQVRLFGQSRKVEAKVLAVSHEADLALLTVTDPTYLAGVPALPMGTLPEVQQEVVAYGFPQGGDTLSSTRGVISRIEHQVYSHASSRLLAAQLDAAINPGNSGGPVIVDGRIVGVVMQSIRGAENIGYMVPVPVVEHLLADLEDGAYHGWPSLGVVWQELENPDLKRYHGVKEGEDGILVVETVPGSPAAATLRHGDVLLAVDGHGIASDGTVELRPGERTSFDWFVQVHQIGEEAKLTITRAGARQDVTARLDMALGEGRLVPLDRYDVRPSWFIYGGALFSPLNQDYLQAWGGGWQSTAPRELVALLSHNVPTQEGEEVVVLVKVLAADLNEGYHDVRNWVITKVNGQPISNLKELVAAVEGAQGEWIVFENPWGAQLVFDRKKVTEGQAQVLETYRIPTDRSADLGG